MSKMTDEIAKKIFDFKFNNQDLLKSVDELIGTFNRQRIEIENCKQINRYAANVSVLLLTANEMERRTLFHYFSNNGIGIVQIPCDNMIYSFFSINEITVAHVEPETIGSYTKGGTARTLERALKRIKPTVVISLGVAFGANYLKHEIGDVIIGRQFFAYDKATKVEKNSLMIKKLHVLEADEGLLYKLKARIQLEQKMTGRLNNEFQAILGNMITGEYVVDSERFRRMVFTPFTPFGVVGGEMEAFGIFDILRKYGDVHGILIKGICDWGAGKNEKSEEEEDKSENNYALPQLDYKNIFQVLAMLNVCTVCEEYLINKNFFSDYKIRGFKKWFWRTIGRRKSFKRQEKQSTGAKLDDKLDSSI